MKSIFWEAVNSMLRYFIFSILMFHVFNSCKTRGAEKVFDTGKLIIDVQPFIGVTNAETQYVFKELKKIYPFVEIKKTIALPQPAYYPARNRFRADSIIHILNNQAIAGHKIMGLTNKDISTTKDGIADWGIMGLGFCPGSACIASTFRLSKNAINDQLFKVAIHELGHTFGLPHCSVKSCFMRDAEGGNTTNEEHEFCSKCKSFLVSKGWKLI